MEVPADTALNSSAFCRGWANASVELNAELSRVDPCVVSHSVSSAMDGSVVIFSGARVRVRKRSGIGVMIDDRRRGLALAGSWLSSVIERCPS